MFKDTFHSKFLYTKLHGPSHGIFVGCIALKAESKTLPCLMFSFIICQNTHSTNPTCDLNSVTKIINKIGIVLPHCLILLDWSSLPWLWRHWMIYVMGRRSQIYQHFFGSVCATLYRETLLFTGAVWPDLAIFWTLGNFSKPSQQLIFPNLPHS